MGQCVLREWAVGVGGLDGHFGEQGLPGGTQECLERFNCGCVDYLSRKFVPKWDGPNGEGELATARTTSLLVEVVGVPRSLLRVGCAKVDAMYRQRAFTKSNETGQIQKFCIKLHHFI